MRRAVSSLVAVLTPLTLAGCFASHGGDDVEGMGWIGPVGECDSAAAPYEAPRCERPGRCVDVLFVIDNRASMREEQVTLFEQSRHLTDVLVSGDVDGDGVVDEPPVPDLHFGVVTADLGSGGTLVDGCLSPDFGDDGMLGRGRTGRLVETCGLDIPRWLHWSAESAPSDFDAWQLDAACSLAVGIFGCPYEQPLDAALKALTESAAPPRFFRNTCGHADTRNAGFLRADSILAVVILSDHDDCSVREPSFFVDAADRGEDPGLVCHEFEERLYNVRRYVAGFAALREDPRDLVFAPVVGVPTDAAPAPGDAPDLAAILAHPDMQARPDSEDPTRLVPSCNIAGRGLTFPPRRYMEVARGLGAAGASTPVASICQADFSPVIDAIQARL
ncbi:MAG: hypothetical protein JRH11_20960 [Deltaproteobacteria bacterium]|nr:hypothetical protein [Deltaproteobacteria bacterium]